MYTTSLLHRVQPKPFRFNFLTAYRLTLRSTWNLTLSHALLEFPADTIAELLEAEAAEEEKVLPRVMSFIVTPEQEQVIEQAVEMASDGTPGRDRKARGLANLARSYLEQQEGAEQ